MTSFPLKIVTPDGVQFDGRAEEIVVRTTTGDLGILTGHMDCVAPLGMGKATIIVDGQRRYGACIGGMLSVLRGAVTLVPTTFEWAENIDEARVQRSIDRAREILKNKNNDQMQLKLAEARLKRALIRQNVPSHK